MTPANGPVQQSDSAGEFLQLVTALSQPAAFPDRVDDVEIRHTHISTVFLGGDVVYKIRKPVKLPFLDFSTLARRKFFCEEEVRINRPWAPEVYDGVVPVTRTETGLTFDGTGPVVDWAVRMRRLPDSATLRSRLQREELKPHHLIRTAVRVARIHQQAERYANEEATDAVADFRRKFNENWDFARDLTPEVIAPNVQNRLNHAAVRWLRDFDTDLKQRATNGFIRELHGDLRLDHVYLFPDRTPPHDILILDGIEFDAALRRIDTAADLAFLLMELAFAGRRDLADVLRNAYNAEFPDAVGLHLMPLFTAYRSAVRAKVAAILGSEPEIPMAEQQRAYARSRAHWLWCLSELEPPGSRPALVLVSGLPGTGKSTLARGLAKLAGFSDVLRTDVVRKELLEQPGSGITAENLYAPATVQRVYDECCDRARRQLCSGRRVILDATFQQDSVRCSFLQLAIDCGIRTVWLECTAPTEIAAQRLAARRGDASDADTSIHHRIAALWQPPSDFSAQFHATIPTGDTTESALESACDVLRKFGLAK